MRSRLPSLTAGWRCWPPLLAALAVVLLAAGPARADLVLSVQNVTATPGSVGNTIEVDLTNTTTASVTLGSFAVSVLVNNNIITFTSADNNTAAPYVFAGHSTFSEMNNNQQVNLNDTYSPVGSGATIGKGTFGMGRLFFNVSPGALPGTVVPVSISSATLADPSGNTLGFTTSPGSITVVSGSAAVPEPSTLALAGLLMSSGAFGYFRRKRALAKQAATEPAPAPAV